MRITAITQARSGSTRLPEKIFKKIQTKTLLEIHLERARQSRRVNQLIVATTLAEQDVRVFDLAQKLNLQSFRGSENDVLDRFYQSVKDAPPDYVVRITSDCPLIDPLLIDAVIDHTLAQKADYGSNVLKETFPDGQDIEVFTFRALETAWSKATLNSDREHVTPFIRKNSDFNGGSLFKAVNYSHEPSYGGVRMTVDEQVDFEVIRDLVERLGIDKGWKEYADYILSNAGTATKNAHIIRNEGYQKSLKKDNV